jgi:hypothetical protein
MPVPLIATAATSATPLGPIIAGAGLALQLASLIGRASEKSPEEIAEERQKRYLETIRRLRGDDIREGLREISESTMANTALARAGAGRRALALGRASDAESFILPAEQQVLNAGAQSRERFLADRNRYWREAELKAEEGLFDIPRSPSVSDYLMEIGGMGTKLGTGLESIEAQREFNDRYISEITALRNAITGKDQKDVSSLWNNGLALPDYGRGTISTVPSRTLGFYRLAPTFG